MTMDSVEIPFSGLLVSARVLVGDSVFEDAQISTREGWLSVEFDAPDLDGIAIQLSELQRPSVR